MAVPTYDHFIEPVLRFLSSQPEGAPARDVHDAAAAALNLSDADRAVRVPSGVQLLYKNRAGWAHDRLKRAGLSHSTKRGLWKLTAAGEAYAVANPPPLPAAEVARLAAAFVRVRLRTQSLESPATGQIAPSAQPPPDEAVASPEERMEDAILEIRESVSADLLESISDASPQFFEGLVLDLLHAMGYGASRDDLRRVGGSGDHGIDGIISLDRLGFEKVYVQAKRWQASIGRPDVQAFYGALAEQKAGKGVFITTSTFTAQAMDFARSVDRIVLIDGERLATLMIDFGVGVSKRSIAVPKLDSDYFDE